MESTVAYKSSRAMRGFRRGVPITSGSKLFRQGTYGCAGVAAATGAFGTAAVPAVAAAEGGSVATAAPTFAPAFVAAPSDAVATIAAIGPTGIGVGTGACPWNAKARAGLVRRVLRRGNWRLSHSRNASEEISTPRPRNAMASTSTESPSRRSRSNSSRCASSCAVFGCFGWRAFATNSASVGGGVGAISWCASGSEGVMWERYSERLRSAMGVGLDQSKPRGLDVGVLTHAFLLFFVISFSSCRLLLRSGLWILPLVEVIRIRFYDWVRSLSLCRFVFSPVDEWVEVVIRSFGGSIAGSAWSLGWGGGGAC